MTTATEVRQQLIARVAEELEAGLFRFEHPKGYVRVELITKNPEFLHAELVVWSGDDTHVIESLGRIDISARPA